MPGARRDPDTRDRLLETGMSAFLHRGYHGAGLKAMLDEAGVPKGSFYNYFTSKEDFASATIHRYAECMSQQLDRALSEHASPIDGLRAFFEAQAESFKEAELTGGCLIANLGAELDDSETCREALRTSTSAYLAGLSAVIASAQAAGAVRSDIEADELAALLSDAWEGAVIRMKIQRTTAPLQSVLDRLLEGFFRP